MNIPEGINYKEADEARKNELKKPQYLNFDKIFYCDPQFVEKVYPNPWCSLPRKQDSLKMNKLVT